MRYFRYLAIFGPRPRGWFPHTLFSAFFVFSVVILLLRPALKVSFIRVDPYTKVTFVYVINSADKTTDPVGVECL